MNKEMLQKLLIGFVSAVLVVWLLVAVVWGAILSGEPLTGKVAVMWPFFFASAGALFGIFVAVTLGMFVYHDAKKRGMEPLLWALVAAVVPYFVGFVVYLVVRQTRQIECTACGMRSRESAFCSHCGHTLQTACAGCGKPVRNGARFCPHCGAAAAPTADDARS